MQQNFFNKPFDEIEMIYKALKDPETNRYYLDSLGLTDVEVLYKKWTKDMRIINKQNKGKAGLDEHLEELLKINSDIKQKSLE